MDQETVNMSATKLSLNANIELQLPTGKSIPLNVQEILWNSEVPNCLIYGKISPEKWLSIWENRAFHLKPEVVLQDLVEFDEDGLITLELALDKTILQSLLTNTDPMETFLYGLGGTTDESEVLLKADSWQAHSVMQSIAVPNDPDATLQIGFQTTWAEDDL